MIDFSLFCSTFRVDAMRTIAVQLKHLYSAVAVAAAQAVTTTLQMQPGRRASGALKPPYAAALGGCTDFWSLLFS